MSNLISFGHIVPELLLGGIAVVLFLFSAFARGKAFWQSVLFPTLAGSGLLIALGLVLYFGLGDGGSGTDCTYGGCKLFFGLLATDPMAMFFRILVIAATFICVIISIGSPALPEDRKGEYHGLLMVMAMGMCFLAASNNLMMIYVAMETVSLCSYLLTGWDSRSQRSREAGMKYVLYGGVASGVMLFGMSLFYGLFGDLSLQGLHLALSGNGVLDSVGGQWAALISIVFILGGLGYKVAAVPFHMWCPDAYQGAPTPFTALLSVGPKAAGMALLLRFFYGMFLVPGSMDNVIGASSQIPWVLIIGIISAITMTIGNLTAIVQNNLKRLLAYSSIAHAGYVLMAVAAGGRDGFEAVTIYMAIYLIMNMGAFAVVAAVSRSTGSDDLRVFRGLSNRAPLLALAMAVFMISLTGLPPTAGFIGKLYLFAALIHRGDFWFIALAVVGIANSAVSLYYYARVLKTMYFEKAEEGMPPVKLGNAPTAVAIALAIPTLLLGIFWQPLAIVARWSATMFH
ncbi:MAG: NADH-quinone oxidoreductase subunit N [Deltaproteobacteria bacterium]|nr:NADH-quinone oxidoreductase subunit N [Deltaproteobacteria bacterium]